MLCYLKCINLWGPSSPICNSVVFNDNFSEENANTMESRLPENRVDLPENFIILNLRAYFRINFLFFLLQHSANSEVVVNEHFVRLPDRRAHDNNELPSNAETPRLIRFIQSSLRPSGEPLPQEFPVATCQALHNAKGCR